MLSQTNTKLPVRYGTGAIVIKKLKCSPQTTRTAWQFLFNFVPNHVDGGRDRNVRNFRYELPVCISTLAKISQELGVRDSPVTVCVHFVHQSLEMFVFHVEIIAKQHLAQLIFSDGPCPVSILAHPNATF